MKRYSLKITGTTPLLMHSDDIDWADRMTAWKDDAANKKDSKAGDDRTPAWRWIGHCYHDENWLSIPSENLMVCLREGGVMVPVPGGKSGKTFKAQTQSGMRVEDFHLPVLIDGKAVPWAPIEALMKRDDIADHKAACQQMGFELYVKRAKVGASKHIRVRPRIFRWSAAATLVVWDKQITKQVLHEIANYAGTYKGIGDWRPGGKTPGSYGMFTANVSEI